MGTKKEVRKQKDITDSLKHDKRYRRFVKAAVPIIEGIYTRKLNLTYDPLPKIDGPCLYMANHTTDMDPEIVFFPIREHAYCVAAENILRSGFWGKVLTYFVNPIYINKNAMDYRAITDVLKVIKAGKKVILFPEGNRSFDGLTAPVGESTAKLVQKAKCDLILLRIEGGFFTQPRFAKGLRKGKMHISFAEHLTSEDVRELDTSELTSLINEKLYENAYERQKEWKVDYKGKNLAEYMESTLFLCPSCRKFGKLYSKGDVLSCECGYSLMFTKRGEILDPRHKSHTLYEFTEFQKEELKRRMEDSSTLLFEDKVSLFAVKNHKRKAKSDIIIKTYTDRVVYSDILDMQKEKELNLKDVLSISIFNRNKLSLNMVSGEIYELRGEDSFNALKYSYYLDYMKEGE
ncbi:MAG: 1-acyl-sn-glycerol-3-phosphate acyltransferase [Lachnospiraceae bacterium]|nr:1-acyl-sn-glycerol-3-phosphate acyltransferase [Lachnospiraceae bacterium]